MSRHSNRLYTKWVVRSAGKVFVALAALACTLSSVAAQSADSTVARTVRQPSLDDLLAFNRIVAPGLSPNGQWFAYTLAPASGNRETILRKLADGREFSFNAGANPGTAVTFSPDGRSAVYTEFAAQNESPSAPPGSVAMTANLVSLATGEAIPFVNVRKFSFNGRAATFLALHLANNDLVLHEVASGQKKNISGVVEFVFDSLGKRLFYTTSAGAVVLRELPAGVERKLDEADANYEQLLWSESDGGLLSVVRSARTAAAAANDVDIIWFTGFSRNTPRKQSYRPTADAGFPRGMVVARDLPVMFTEDRSGVYFTVRAPETAAASAPANPRRDSSVRVWQAEDMRVRQQHRLDDAQERASGFLMLARPSERKFFQLEDSTYRRAIVGPHDRWAIVVEDQTGLQLDKPAPERRHDVHVVDLRTGRRRLALMAAASVGTMSPDGQKFWFHSDNNYFVFEIASGQSRNLTRSLSTTFPAASNDPRGMNGVLGWSSDSKSLLISDGWDVWNVPTSGSRAVNVTANGKRDSIRYGPILFEAPDRRGIDIRKQIFLRTYGEWTKREGVVRVDVNKSVVTPWLSDSARIVIGRAAEADVFFHSRETVSDYPDFFVTNGAMQAGSRVTRANSQQLDLAWSPGTRLVNYTAAGERLQGALQLPAGFEEGKSYPTIVLLGQGSSHSAHSFSNAAALNGSVSNFNAAFFTGRGYAVLLPDIAKLGSDPGASVTASVVAAVNAAVASGVTDSAGVGLYGQGYGGWQAASVIARDSSFAAALLVAPVTDLAAIRSSVMAEYPIPKNSYAEVVAPLSKALFSDAAAVLQNSPLYASARVNTPVLIQHNIDDPSVEFAQGADFYNSLRRNGKGVVLIDYAGEGHTIAAKENQIDFALRSLEFFDHHLKGGAAPSWWR